MSNIIKYSQLLNSDFIDKKRSEMVESWNVDDVFIENDKNATPKEIFDAYTKVFSLKSKSLFNSELGKKWQNHPENTDKDSYFKMPSLEYIAVGDKQDHIFADEDGKYYSRHSGEFRDVKKMETDRFKKANGEIEEYQQGPSGTCWVNGGIESISKFNNNAEIKKCMKKNPDGSWIVTFRGVDGKPQFTVTPEEFSSQRNFHLSSGDPDMKILEIATRKLIKSGLISEKKHKQNLIEPLKGGEDYEMYKYLLDKDEFKTYGFNTRNYQENENQKHIKPNRLNKLFNILEKLEIKIPKISSTAKNSQNSFSLSGSFSDKLEDAHVYSVDHFEKTEKIKINPKDGSFKIYTEDNVFLRNSNNGRSEDITRQEFFESMDSFAIAVPTKNHELFNTCDENNTSDICKDYQTLQELRKKLEEE